MGSFLASDQIRFRVIISEKSIDGRRIYRGSCNNQVLREISKIAICFRMVKEARIPEEID